MLRRKKVRLVVSRCLQGRGSGAESNNVLCTCVTIFNRTQTVFFLHVIPFLKRLIATQQSAHCLLMFRPVRIYKFVLNVIAAQREHCLQCHSLRLDKSNPLQSYTLWLAHLGHLNICTKRLWKGRSTHFWSSKWWRCHDNWIFIDGRIKIISLNLWWWPKNSEHLILILWWTNPEQSGWRLSPSLSSQCVTVQREEMGWKARDVVLYMNGLISGI